MHSWNLDDMPDLSGRTAVVTGANSGIGAVTALALARSGARTLLACRDPERGRRALEAVRRAAPRSDARLVRLDLADLASVAEAADTVAKEADGC
ncbi:SDR family NAD(P)-dependent oxidoreductase, partial [Streptomyces nanshensis]